MIDQELWRRRNASFQVEILVGKAWTKHAERFNTFDEALSESSKIGLDPAVSEVRVLEDRITHVCIVAHHADTASIVKLPPTMMNTGEKKSCRVCGGVATIADDGSDQWSVCPHCERTVPAA